MQTVNLREKFKHLPEVYLPKIVGELNGQYVKIVRIKGKYIMHSHENEDEMFLVLKGSFNMEYEDRTEKIGAGEFVIVPKGVQHCPNAQKEALVLLFEPKSVVNTGDTESQFTVKPEELKWI